MGAKPMQLDHDDGPSILKFPSVFRPQEQDDRPTTPSSGSVSKSRPKSCASQKQFPFERLDSAGLLQAEMLARQYADPVLTPEAAARVAETTTLAGYYKEIMRPRLVGQRAAKTLEHYVTALNQWETYAPKLDLPEWSGMPVKLITGRYVEAFFEAASEQLENSTIELAWKKVRAILNDAKRLKVIDKIPKPKLLSVEDGAIVTYSDDEIVRAYAALKDHLELQVAFVLAVNAGLRPIDLFRLHRDALDLGNDPSITFTAQKTGKLQRVPLAAVTVAQLRRLPRDTQYLFPSLGNPKAQAPESSAAATKRNELFKSLIASVGLTHERPWKVCRATCNTRLEACQKGVGEFVLGHCAKGVNAKHYNDRTQVVTDTINRVPQPACFFEFPHPACGPIEAIQPLSTDTRP